MYLPKKSLYIFKFYNCSYISAMKKVVFYLLTGLLLLPVWSASAQENGINYSFRETLPLLGRVKSVRYSNGTEFKFDERGELAVPDIYEVSSLVFPDEFTREQRNKGEVWDENDSDLILDRWIFNSGRRVVVNQSRYRYVGQSDTKYIYSDELSRFPVRTITRLTDERRESFRIMDYEYLEFDEVGNWLRRGVSYHVYTYDYPALSDEPVIYLDEKRYEETAEYVYF